MTMTLDRAESETEDHAAAWSVPTRPWIPWAIMGLSVVSFVSSVGSIKAASSIKSEWGLIGTASPLWVASFFLAALAFVFAVRNSSVRAVLASTVAMGIAVHLPKTIANDVPMFAWTYKHIGVADYFQHAHSLARGIDIYNGWPSAFAFAAWFSELTGVPLIDYAHWFTPVFHALLGAMVYGAARVWNLSPLAAASAVFMVITLNWVQQDYFSPQANMMLFVPGILIVLGLSRDRATGTLLLVILFGAGAITHQLTPYWIFGCIGLLAITRRFKPWWALIPLGLILVGQLLYNWQQVSQYELFSSDVFSNMQSNITRFPVHPVIGQRVVSYGNKLESGIVWGGTLLALLYRWRKKQPFWQLAVISLSPMLLFGGASYGGETVFRVYLYSIVGCCIVLAPVVVDAIQASCRLFFASTAALLVATICAVNGETAAWYAFVMPKSQVETSMKVLETAELPAYITSAAPTWPERISWRYVGYAKFQEQFDAPMITKVNLIGRKFDNDEDYKQIVDALYSRSDASTYLIITDQTQVYCWYFGILPWEALPNLKKYLYRDAERWEPFYEGNGVSVFVHRVAPKAGPAPEAPPAPESPSTPAPTESSARLPQEKSLPEPALEH
ncbi:Uncharacterised protein [Mycobacteroides abscessus subsp. abscessus]|nr:Uncharacterised protein [Mycobacteroides abscessus subsp. abscessus]